MFKNIRGSFEFEQIRLLSLHFRNIQWPSCNMEVNRGDVLRLQSGDMRTVEKNKLYLKELRAGFPEAAKGIKGEPVLWIDGAFIGVCPLHCFLGEGGRFIKATVKVVKGVDSGALDAAAEDEQLVFELGNAHTAGVAELKDLEDSVSSMTAQIAEAKVCLRDASKGERAAGERAADERAADAALQSSTHGASSESAGESCHASNQTASSANAGESEGLTVGVSERRDLVTFHEDKLKGLLDEACQRANKFKLGKCGLQLILRIS